MARDGIKTTGEEGENKDRISLRKRTYYDEMGAKQGAEKTTLSLYNGTCRSARQEHTIEMGMNKRNGAAIDLYGEGQAEKKEAKGGGLQVGWHGKSMREENGRTKQVSQAAMLRTRGE